MRYTHHDLESGSRLNFASDPLLVDDDGSDIDDLEGLGLEFVSFTEGNVVESLLIISANSLFDSRFQPS